MDARQSVVQRGLVPAAVATLTARAFGQLPFDAMGPTKALLKRFFSPQHWETEDDEALADAVGPGEGWWIEPLDGQVGLAFGWERSRFRLRATSADVTEVGSAVGEPLPPGHDRAQETRPQESAALSLEATFDGPIAPEATPNPRTLVFRTATLHEGESRSYRSGTDAVDDPRVAQLLATFPDVATVLVARRFVALTLRRPDRWEVILAPVLDAVAGLFPAPADPDPGAGSGSASGPPHGGPAALAAVPRSGSPADAGGAVEATVGRATRLDRAWRELGHLRAADPAGIERILAAASSPDAAFRQVAAGLVADGPADVAYRTWESLAGDPIRAVRRAAVDAVVDAGRGDLRPLLERALGDPDAWVRWKALRGLAELGIGPSLAAVRALTADPDFRVRLEAHAALGREG